MLYVRTWSKVCSDYSKQDAEARSISCYKEKLTTVYINVIICLKQQEQNRTQDLNPDNPETQLDDQYEAEALRLYFVMLLLRLQQTNQSKM